MTSDQIRRQFIEFFHARGHSIVPSSPVVPHDDPTLLFTNAGMNQFKPIFLGQRAADVSKWHGVVPGMDTRAANSQKCIRAGGKHNDLDDVGKDTYHHTFFEMLGNWSFGDYFKKEAIEWAWELLTKVWGIPKGRLHATYFGGTEAQRDKDATGESESLPPDLESRDLWLSVTDIDPSHVHPGSMKDNFWEMGDTGPCGPCSEIHIDLTSDAGGGALVNAGDARVMEIWNLVFIQFNRGGDGKLTLLPAKHVDTGMGFERICAVLQGLATGRLGHFTNYDTDVFTPIFEAIRRRTGAPEYRGTLPDGPRTSDRMGPASRERSGPHESLRGPKAGARDQVMIDVSYRVIADHLRALTFAITDGAIPGNEGRGFVLRRILRRAVRFGRQYLDMHEPFLCDLVEPLVAHMSDAFPELRNAHGGKNIRHVTDIIRQEEASFLKTLDRGMKLFDEAAEYAVASHHGRIQGDAAFKLHDTYGFPIDLTEQMAGERGLTVDIGEYERLMEESRRVARARGHVASHTPTVFPPSLVADLPRTDESHKYGALALDDAVALAVLRFEPDGGVVRVRNPDSLHPPYYGAVVLDKTCFYAEQGGQVGDTGVLASGDEDEDQFVVENTIRVGDAILHIGLMRRGAFGDGDFIHIRVDAQRRRAIEQNHTATHLLNWALREALCPPEERVNPHVQQKGSLVDAEKTRFDFSHGQPLSEEQIEHIEGFVKMQIAADHIVYAASREEDFVDQTAARKINTLRAVFGEKYPEKVRVVSIGAPITEADAKVAGKGDWLLKSPHNPDWMRYSVEFCGGTHVKRTSEIEDFVIVSEEAVAKGVRRVVGVTAQAAREARAKAAALRDNVTALWDVPEDGFHARLVEAQKEFADAVIPVLDRCKIREQLDQLVEKGKKLEKQKAAASGSAVMDRVAEALEAAHAIAGVTILVTEVPPALPDALRSAIDWVRQKTEASAVLLACVGDDGKVTLLAGMSKTVVDRGLKAGDLIRQISPLVGGKGGGRPDLAQGGGADADSLPKALEAAADWIRQKLA